MIEKITPVDGFMTTDGVFFPSRNEAVAHQHGIDIQPEVESYINYGGSFTDFQAMRHIIEWEEHKKLKELGGK